MADGQIKIDIQVDGKQVDAASKSLDNLEVSGTEAGKGAKNAEDGLKGVGDESNKASGNIKKFVAALGLVAIGAAVFNTLRKSLDDAISRFDTLNSFPKVMEQIGFSAEESEAAINKLSDGIEGLPTKLDDVASTAQQIAVMTGDLDGAVDTTLALNNAFLASGAFTADAQRGLQQYVQMLSKGEVDLQSWRTLQETMGVALNDVAKAFGFAGESAQNDLYDALKSGEITFNEFNAKLIELSNETGGFADRAKTASAGIATSLGNLRNAAARGIAGIIDSFNKLSLAVTGKDIAHHIDSMKVVINAAFNAIKSTIEATAPVFKAFGVVIQGAISVLKPLTPAIIGAATAYAGLMIVNKISAVIKAHTAILLAAETSQKLLAVSTKATTVATAAQTGVIGASTLAIGVLTGRIGLATAAKLAFAAATKAVGLALKAFAGPIGWITIAIGALVGAVVGIVKWFNRTSDEAERLSEETEALGESTDSLVDSMDQSASAYKDRVRDIEATHKANSDLIKTVDDLSNKENKSADDKRALSIAVEQLNGEVEGLTVSYNEEADMLSESTKKMKARIDLMAAQDKANAAQERLTEILKEQQDVELQLEEVSALREHWNGLIEKGGSDARKARGHIKELDEQEEQLIATLEALGIQFETTHNQAVESTEEAKNIISDNNQDLIISYEDLEGKAKEAFDSMADRYNELKDAATDAFDKIEDKTDHTMDSMIDTMQHNQEMVEQWGKNQATLMEWAGENSYESFIPFIESMGIDQAAVLQEMVDDLDKTNGSSGEKLSEMAETYQEGGELSSNALKEALGEGFEEVVDLMSTLVDRMETILRTQINEADWEKYGLEPPNQIGSGIEGGTAGVLGAVSNLTSGIKLTTAADLASSVFEEYGKNPPTGVASGINNNAGQAETAASNMGNSVHDAAYEPLWRENFVEIGAGVGIGLGIGIDNNAGSAISAASNLGTAVLGAASAALEVNSPSRAMIRIGKFVVDGLRNGINSSEANATGAMVRMNEAMLRRAHIGMEVLNRTMLRGVNNINKTIKTLPVLVNAGMTAMQARLSTGAARNLNIMSRLSTNMISPFRNTRGQMASVGANAMAGLQAGLNGGAGRVMATARGIASRVASTMKAALKIKSPSRIMKDDVGKWIPAGIAVGIEDNAKLVYKALEDLSAGMIKPVSPEVALGTSAMAYNGSDSMAQAVKNIRIPENKPDGSVAGLLREQNNILTRLLNKDNNTYLDGEKLTNAVNRNNAILASLGNVYGG